MLVLMPVLTRHKALVKHWVVIPANSTSLHNAHKYFAENRSFSTQYTYTYVYTCILYLFLISVVQKFRHCLLLKNAMEMEVFYSISCGSQFVVVIFY